MTSREELEELMFSLQYHLETKEDLERILEIKAQIKQNCLRDDYLIHYYQVFIVNSIANNLNKYLDYFKDDNEKKKQFLDNFIKIEDIIEQLKKTNNDRAILQLYFIRISELSKLANNTFNFQGWKYGLKLFFLSTDTDKEYILNEYHKIIGNKRKMKDKLIREYFLLKYSYNPHSKSCDSNYEKTILSSYREHQNDNILNNYFSFNYSETSDSMKIENINIQEKNVAQLSSSNFRNIQLLLNITENNFRLSIIKQINWYFEHRQNEKPPIDKFMLTARDNTNLYFFLDTLKKESKESRFDYLYNTTIIRKKNRELFDKLFSFSNQILVIKHYNVLLEPIISFKEFEVKIKENPVQLISFLQNAIQEFLNGNDEYESQIIDGVNGLYTYYNKLKDGSFPNEVSYCVLIMRLLSRIIKKESTFNQVGKVNKHTRVLYKVITQNCNTNDIKFNKKMVNSMKKSIKMDKKLHFIFLVIDMIYKSLDSKKIIIKKVEHLLEVFQQMETINVKDDVLLNTIESLLTFLKENKNYWFVILWKLFQLQECFIQNKNWNHFFHKLINDCMFYNFSFSDSTIIKQVKKKCVECFNQYYLSPNNNIENNIAILLLIQSKIVENKIFIKEMKNNKDKFFAKYIISENINLKFSVMYCTLLLNNKAIFPFLIPLTNDSINRELMLNKFLPIKDKEKISITNNKTPINNYFLSNNQTLIFELKNEVKKMNDYISDAKKNNYQNVGILISQSQSNDTILFSKNEIWYSDDNNIMYLNEHTIYDYLNNQQKEKNSTSEVYYYFYFEKVKQNSEIKEEDLIIAFIDSAIKTNSLTSLIFPSLMYELLFSHIEILIQYKEKIKQYIHHSLTNAKWAIKVLSLQEKQKIKQQYHSDLSDILSDLSFTDNELSKEYNSIINYLKKK